MSVEHWMETIALSLRDISTELGALNNESARPCVLFRPALSVDGNQWCALYGANIQDGVAGFGDSPAAAMYEFDRNWHRALKSKGSSDAK